MAFCHSCVCAKSLQSCSTLVTVWTVAHQAPPSMGFSRQEYWSWLPCPPLGDLPDPGIKSMPLSFPALAGGFLATSATWEAPNDSQNSEACLLRFTVYCKGEKLETAKWKTCTRPSMWKVRDMNDSRALSQHSSMFSNLEAC